MQKQEHENRKSDHIMHGQRVRHPHQASSGNDINGTPPYTTIFANVDGVMWLEDPVS